MPQACAHKLVCRAPPLEASGPLEVAALADLRLDEELRDVQALAVRGAWELAVRGGRERRGAQEIWIAERRAARSADVLAREDSRERRAVMDSNSVLVLMTSPK